MAEHNLRSVQTTLWCPNEGDGAENPHEIPWGFVYEINQVLGIPHLTIATSYPARCRICSHAFTLDEFFQLMADARAEVEQHFNNNPWNNGTLAASPAGPSVGSPSSTEAAPPHHAEGGP